MREEVDLLSAAELAGTLRISRRQLARLVAGADFPAPVMLGRRLRRWRVRDVARWLQARAVRPAQVIV